jgi:hypothetical protein
MKKVLILAAVTASFAVGGIAMAGTPGSSNNNSPMAKMTGQGKAMGSGGADTYTDPVFGQVTCNETQHPQFDTVSCTMATPLSNAAGSSGTVGWYSDFNGKLGTFTYTVSADGSSYSGKATYN